MINIQIIFPILATLLFVVGMLLVQPKDHDSKKINILRVSQLLTKRYVKNLTLIVLSSLVVIVLLVADLNFDHGGKVALLSYLFILMLLIWGGE